MKKLLFLGVCLVALASQPVMAQTDAADIVVVKVTEGYGTLEFDIARAAGNIEHRKFNLKQLKENGGTYATSGQAQYTRSLLVELAKQGYALTTTYTANDGSINGPTTLIFIKRQ